MVAVARRRVADDDAEDVVQATLAEALTSKEKPQDPDALRRWLWGVLRHKIADHYRKRRREVLDDSVDAATDSPDEATEDLLRWAVQRLPQGGDVQETFQWLLREGEGEKLESIAEEAGIPAPRVRKRVSRLRQHLRTHWMKEVAVLAALGIVATLAYLFVRRPLEREGVEIALPDPAVQEQERKRQRGIELRRDGLRDCSKGLDDACIQQLDEAKKLDPAGEDEVVLRARKAVEGRKLTPENTLDQKAPFVPLLSDSSSLPEKPIPAPFSTSAPMTTSSLPVAPPTAAPLTTATGKMPPIPKIPAKPTGKAPSGFDAPELGLGGSSGDSSMGGGPKGKK